MTLFGNRGYGRGGGGKMRLIIAAVIAIFGLATYFLNTQDNPITGEKQRVGNLSPKDEVAMGYNSMPELIQQMGGKVPDTDPRARFVQEVGQKLLQRQPKLLESDYKFTFTLLDDPETVNAFALPGGPVFITRALLERLENEAQLAGVLGHEIGHVVHRHGAQRMAKAGLGQTLTLAVGVGASGEDRNGQMAAAAAALASQIMLMKYSREDELESDGQGLKYLVDSGYDPSEMIRVMEILKQASGSSSRAPNFMASHPDPDARIAQIRGFLKDHFPNGVPATLTKGRELR
jgi:beta-barrel assembly-enhancing protease